MFIENNPLITVYNYHTQDLKFREDQIGPTYKTWQQSDMYYREPNLFNSKKLDYYSEDKRPIFELNNRFKGNLL
jgi:hypothetical protein